MKNKFTATWPMTFGFIYLTLYALPFPLNWFGDESNFFDEHYMLVTKKAATWFFNSFLNLNLNADAWNNHSSSDTPIGFFILGCCLILAALMTFGIHTNKKYILQIEKAYPWLYLFLKTYLAFNMFVYGFAKVFPNQFSDVTPIERLYQPFGSYSPTALIWNFMGSSTLYTIFAGLSEVLPAFLLFFSNYTLIGALIIFPVLVNVFLINMSYDVCVKVHSFQLLCVTFLLIAPNIKNIWNFFHFKQADLIEINPQLKSRKSNMIFVALYGLFFISSAGYSVFNNWNRYKKSHEEIAETKHYGSWVIDHNESDQETKDWYRVIFNLRKGFSFQKNSGELVRYKILDEKDQVPNKDFPITIQDRFDPKAPKENISITSQGDSLLIKGTLQGKLVELKAKKENDDSFLLKTRGFNLMNDTFYSR